MKTVGLITEYNPFHNGHLYHIEKAKELTGAARVIVIMSGDYVQRGTPAVLSKHSRAHMALLNGASVVLELPVCYSCASAEFFAKGAVSVLDGLGCIDALCFGSECGNLEHLTSIAHLLSAEPETYRHHLQSSLKNGMSFPAARCHALEKMTGDAYVPFTLKREFSGYHDTELHDCSSSASAIRKVLMNIPASPYLPKNISAQLSEQLPPGSLSIIQNEWNFSCPVEADDFSLLLKYRLLSEPHESLCKYQDVSEELSNRIIRNRNQFRSFGQFCTLLKTKELTYSRISRSLLHILLSITTEDMHAYQDNSCSYARILGFRKEHTDVLRAMKDHASIPIITKLGKSASLLSPEASRMLNQTSFASDLYESVISDKFGIPFTSEQQKQIIRV